MSGAGWLIVRDFDLFNQCIDTLLELQEKIIAAVCCKKRLLEVLDNCEFIQLVLCSYVLNF